MYTYAYKSRCSTIVEEQNGISKDIFNSLPLRQHSCSGSAPSPPDTLQLPQPRKYLKLSYTDIYELYRHIPAVKVKFWVFRYSAECLYLLRHKSIHFFMVTNGCVLLLTHTHTHTHERETCYRGYNTVWRCVIGASVRCCSGCYDCLPSAQWFVIPQLSTPPSVRLAPRLNIHQPIATRVCMTFQLYLRQSIIFITTATSWLSVLRFSSKHYQSILRRFLPRTTVPKLINLHNL